MATYISLNRIKRVSCMDVPDSDILRVTEGQEFLSAGYEEILEVEDYPSMRELARWVDRPEDVSKDAFYDYGLEELERLKKLVIEAIALQGSNMALCAYVMDRNSWEEVFFLSRQYALEKSLLDAFSGDRPDVGYVDFFPMVLDESGIETFNRVVGTVLDYDNGYVYTLNVG